MTEEIKQKGLKELDKLEKLCGKKGLRTIRSGHFGNGVSFNQLALYKDGVRVADAIFNYRDLLFCKLRPGEPYMGVSYGADDGLLEVCIAYGSATMVEGWKTAEEIFEKWTRI